MTTRRQMNKKMYSPRAAVALPTLDFVYRGLSAFKQLAEKLKRGFTANNPSRLRSGPRALPSCRLES